MNSIFPHVFGQERVKQAWAKAIENHRMASTSIFYGEEGLGKTTAARLRSPTSVRIRSGMKTMRRPGWMTMRKNHFFTCWMHMFFI